MKVRNHLLISVSVLATCVAAPAFAQSASTDGGIEQVVVTAERHESTVQKTAASITVRSGEELLAQGRYSLANILEDVVGVSGGAATTTFTSKGSGSDNPSAGLTIRGISSNSGTAGSVTSLASAAAIYVDDVYNGIGSGYDINRVEVLRGPQGTLYGRSATSGVVSIHTNDPNLEDFGADATAELGDYGLQHYAGALNIPVVTDQLAVRVSGNYYRRDSFWTNDGGDKDLSDDMRVKALWQPTANFSALFGFAYNDTHTSSSGVNLAEVAPRKYTITDAPPVGPGHNKSLQVWGNFNLDLGGVHINYIPTFRTFSQNQLEYFNQGPLSGVQTIETGPDHFTTQELRVSSNTDSAFRWQTGVFYYDNTLSDSSVAYNYYNGGPGNPYNGQPYLAYNAATQKKTTELGLFAETTWAILPDTRLTTGIRWDTSKITADETYCLADASNAAIPPITYPINCGSLTPSERTSKFNNFTYKARLEHDITPENLIYGSVSSGFSPGDVSLTQDVNYQPVPLHLGAETLTAYEIGSKNRFLDDKLQVNGDVYYYDYGGYQVADINVSHTATPSFIDITVPMKAYGAELEVLWKPWEDGQFSGSVDYNFSQYHGIPAAYAQYFAYHHVPGVAPLRINAGYNHTIPISDSMALILNGTVRYNAAYRPSEIYTSQVNTVQPGIGYTGGQLDRNNAAVIADFNATLNLNDGKYSLTGYVRNIGNVRYMNTVFVLTAPPPIASQTLPTFNDPRTWGVVGTVHF